jgi:hypothetical protein
MSLAVSGPFTSIVGYYIPSMIATTILAPIATGLLTTLPVSASLGTIIGYQSFLGFGLGLGYQGPQIAAQTLFSVADTPLAIAVVMFAQNLGPALFVPVAQTIFESRLDDYLAKFFDPSNNPAGSKGTSIDNMGLLNLRQIVPVAELPAALLGFDRAVTQTFFLPVGLACATVIGTVGMEWRSLKVKNS